MTDATPHMSMVLHSLPSAHVPVGHVLPSLHKPSAVTMAEASASVASGLLAQMGAGSMLSQMGAEQKTPIPANMSKARRLRMNQMMYRIMLIIRTLFCTHPIRGPLNVRARDDHQREA